MQVGFESGLDGKGSRRYSEIVCCKKKGAGGRCRAYFVEVLKFLRFMSSMVQCDRSKAITLP